MRRIDRAVLKRSLGGGYPNGPRGSTTLRNEAEGRVYFLGWSSLYRDFVHPLATAEFFPPAGAAADKYAAEWHAAIERVRHGELEAGLVLQVPQDPAAATLQAERILDGVFFGAVVSSGGELFFRAEHRAALNAARAPRRESA